MTTITIRDHDGADVIMGAELDGTSYRFQQALVGGPARVYKEITRPSNTTPYSAGDCIADNTEGATTHYIEAGRLNALGGKITQVDVATDLRTWTAGITIVLYDAVPTAFTADHAAFPGRAYADMANIIGIVDFSALAADAAVSGAAAIASTTCSLNFKCAAATKKIYFEMFTDGTPTPASGQKFTVVLHVDQN
jgi:hypothetical protein